MTSTLELIYRRRQFLGLRNQQQHRQDLVNLGRQLRQKGIPHPYGPEAWDLIRASESISNALTNCPKGPRLDFTALDPPTAFIYRLHRLDQIAWLPFLRTLGGVDRIFAFLQNEPKRRHLDWLRLAEYAKGPISNPRRFSWWTTFTPPSTKDFDQLAGWAKAVGLPSDFLHPNMVLLRIDQANLSELATVHVPSALDGFDSAVFHPQPYTTPSKPGKTIDLNTFPASLTPGREEFTLAPVPVRFINFAPVDNFLNRHGVALDEELFLCLLDYYKGV